MDIIHIPQNCTSLLKDLFTFYVCVCLHVSMYTVYMLVPEETREVIRTGVTDDCEPSSGYREKNQILYRNNECSKH